MIEIKGNQYKYFGEVARYYVYWRVHENFMGRDFHRFIASEKLIDANNNNIISKDNHSIYLAIEEVKEKQKIKKLEHEYWYQKAG